ncbi:MAG: hypothetical protein ACI9KE_006508 [Polyangiales bacterium]|jgi:hypothetical protein
MKTLSIRCTLVSLCLALAGCPGTTDPDAGMLDATTSDVSALDAGVSDAGPSDTGASDAGPNDAGTSDSGVSDTGTSDSGPADSGPPIDPPVVESFEPASDLNYVDRRLPIHVTFDKDMAAPGASDMEVRVGGVLVGGDIDATARTWTFVPSGGALVEPGPYTVRVAMGVLADDGGALTADATWNFGIATMGVGGTSPTDLARSVSALECPEVDANELGHVGVSWQENGTLYFRARTPSGGWGVTEEVATDVSGSAMALSRRAGRAIIGWTATFGEKERVFGRVWDVATGLGEAALLDDVASEDELIAGSECTGFLGAGASPDGDLVVSWTRTNMFSFVYPGFARNSVSTETWSTDDERSSWAAYGPRRYAGAAIDDDGDLRIAWGTENGAYFWDNPNGGGHTTNRYASSRHGNTFALHGDGSRFVYAVWAFGRLNAYASDVGGLGSAITLAEQGTALSSFGLASEGGQAHLFFQDDAADPTLRLYRLAEDDDSFAPVALNLGFNPVRTGSVSNLQVSGEDTVAEVSLLAWTEDGVLEFARQSTTPPPIVMGLVDARSLPTLGEPVSWMRLDADGAGHYTVVWQQPDAGENTLRAWEFRTMIAEDDAE